MFTTRLKEARTKQGLTQQNVADMLGVAFRTYQDYEGGKTYPSIDRLIKISDIFNTSIDYLLGRDEFLASLGVSFGE